MAEENKIICFDLDGTLIDSSLAHAEAFNLAFRKNNLPSLPIEKIISEFGPPAELIAKKLCKNISERKLQQVIKDKNKFLIQKTAKLAKQIRGVAGALKELAKKFKLAIISNSVQAEAKVLLAAAGLQRKLFAAVLCVPEMHKKPDPDIIDAVEEKANGKVEWIVGDTIYDIRTGKLADVQTIAVLTGVHNAETLSKEEPTIILQSVALLPKYFEVEL